MSVPRTFPSTLDAAGRRSMLISPITNYDPNGRWRDWIPVRTGTNSSKVNTYDEDGGLSMTLFTGNGAAWRDYVPVVFVSADDRDSWDVSAVGFTPGFGDVPALSMDFANLEFPTTGMTFTRAGDRSATVIDNEGIIWPCRENELRMVGFRRVENSPGVTQSDSLIGAVPGVNAVWSPGTISGPFPGSVGSQVRWLADLPTAELLCPTAFFGPGRRAIMSVWLRSLDGSNTAAALFAFTSANVTLESKIVTITPEWQRFNLTALAVVAPADGLLRFRIARSGAGSLNRELGIFGLQIEPVVPSQTVPSEYVNFGVLSSPFHGYFADGVKYFKTDRTGALIPETTRQGLLVEGSSTNLLTRSDAFSSDSWGKTDVVVTADNAVDPAGTSLADTLQNGSAGNASVTQQGTITAGAIVSGSVYVKAGTCPWILLQIYDAAIVTDAIRTYIELATGTVGTTVNFGSASGATAVVESAGNGWYRITVAGRLNLTCVNPILLVVPVTGDNVTARPVNATWLMWGAQLEQRVFPSSYIPTTSSTVTRSNDLPEVTIPAQLMPVTLYSDASSPYASSTLRWGVVLNNGGTSFTSMARIKTSPSSVVNAVGEIWTNSAAQAALTLPIGGSPRVKAAMSVDVNNTSFCINGSAPVSDLSVTAWTTGATSFKVGFFPGEPLNGTLKSVGYYRSRLSDTKLQSLTA